MYKNNTSSTNK